jgi:predicted Zn-dependent protease
LLSACSGIAKRAQSLTGKSEPIPQRNLKTLLVLGFATQSDDGLLWGPYCSRILQEKIQFAPEEIVSIPAPNMIYGFYQLARVPREKYMTANEEMENYLAGAYNIDQILTGTVTVKDDSISFNGFIRSKKSKGKPIPVTMSGSLSKPSDFINQLGLEVLSKLKITLTDSQKEYIKKSNTGTPEAFKLAAQAFTKPATEDKEAIALYGKVMNMDSTFIFGAMGATERVIDDDPLHDINFADYVRLKHPESPSFTILELYSLENSDNEENRIFHLSQDVLKNNPENLYVNACLAFSQAKLKHYDQAETTARKLMAMYPGSWYSHYAYQHVAESRAFDARNGNFYNQMNKQQMKDFDHYFEVALEEAEVCAKLHPKSPFVWSMLISDLLENGYSREKIEDVFSNATTINPHYKPSWESLLWCYRPGYSDDPEKGSRLIAEAMRLNPEDPDFACFVLDNLQWYIYNHHEDEANKYFISDTTTVNIAMNCLVSYGKAHPENDKYLLNAASYLSYARMRDKAWVFYQMLKDPPESIKDNPHDYYRFKAWAANAVKENAKAAHYADLCLASQPCNNCASDAYLIKAMDIFIRSQDEQGFQYMEKAIQLSPENTFAKSQYARYAGLARKHIDEGLVQVNAAMQAEPDDAWNYAYQARLYLCKKDKVKALKSINEALYRDSRELEFGKIRKEIQALP